MAKKTTKKAIFMGVLLVVLGRGLPVAANDDDAIRRNGSWVEKPAARAILVPPWTRKHRPELSAKLKLRSGETEANFVPFDHLATSLVQPNGKILLVGMVRQVNGEMIPALTRFDADGRPDVGFGQQGKTTLPQWPGVIPMSALLQADGKIMIGVFVANPGLKAGLVRLLPDGSPDSAYGDDGLSMTWLDAYPVALRAVEGKKMLVQYLKEIGPHRVGLAVFDEDGKPDESFGESGLAVTDAVYASTTLLGGGVEISADGKMVLPAFVGTAENRRPAILRLDADGSPDTSFGPDGFKDISSLPGIAFHLAGSVASVIWKEGVRTIDMATGIESPALSTDFPVCGGEQPSPPVSFLPLSFFTDGSYLAFTAYKDVTGTFRSCVFKVTAGILDPFFKTMEQQIVDVDAGASALNAIRSHVLSDGKILLVIRVPAVGGGSNVIVKKKLGNGGVDHTFGVFLF